MAPLNPLATVDENFENADMVDGKGDYYALATLGVVPLCYPTVNFTNDQMARQMNSISLVRIIVVFSV
jgi:hypothetical protein